MSMACKCSFDMRDHGGGMVKDVASREAKESIALF